MHVSAGRGAVAEALAMDVKGVGPAEDGHHGSVSEGPAHFEGTLSRELLTSHGTHLGNRLPLWLCSAPLALLQPFSGTSGKPWPPPRARAAEPWRQRSMTSPWLILNRVSDKCVPGNQ